MIISGLFLFTCAILLRLLVPIIAEWGNSSIVFAFRLKKASLGSCLFVNPDKTKPSGRFVGISFKLCTAKSISCFLIASSNASVNKPLSPIFDKDLFRIWSPFVLKVEILYLKFGAIIFNLFIIWFVCHKASWLALLPTLIVVFIIYLYI